MRRMFPSARVRVPVLIAALTALSACDDGPSEPIEVPPAGRIVGVTLDAAPRVWVQTLGADRTDRVRFTDVTDPIPGNHPELIVNDATILALGPVKWAPDGERVAVVTTVAYDQSEVVILDTDGGGGRVASVNTQSILSDVAWATDGRRIAYMMSTLPHAAGVDLFVTDLTTNRVTRLTEGYQPGVAGVEIAFDVTGQSLLVTKLTGGATARLDRIDAATGARTTVATDLPGEPQGISQSGAWVLLLKRAGGDRVLVRHILASGAEVELARGPGLQFAELDARGENALVVFGDDRSEHRIVRLSDGASSPVTLTERGSVAVDLYR